MSTHVSPTKVVPAHAVRADQHPPAFISRFFKMPLVFYRLGLGGIFGKYFMVLTHVGRRSGKVYQSVLAILTFDERTRDQGSLALELQ